MLADPLQINDWDIKKFLIAIAVVQAGVLILVVLSVAGISVPVLQYLFGFLYLTFIPGVVLLRILKMHRLGTVRALLYTVGLSLAFDMFVGFMVNAAYPFIGITRPMDVFPVLIAWILILVIVCFIAYWRDRDFSKPTQFEGNRLLTPPVLLLCVLPLLSVLATILLNFYMSTIPQLIILGIIAAVVAMAALGKFIKPDLYPLAVFCISLTLLLHQSLVSFYLFGFDGRIEYYIQHLVAIQGVWDPVNPADNYNAMLSVTVLPTIYSNFLGTDGMWIFKAVWPFLFSLTPLCLYQAYKIHTTEKIAFMAAFYFLIVAVFLVAITMLGRQEIAMLFLALLVLLFSDGELSKLHRVILAIIYGLAIVVSHYSTAYLMSFYASGALLILLFFKRKGNLLTFGFATLLIVASFSWYIFTTNSSIFAAIINMGKNLSNVFLNELLAPFSREFVFMLTTNIVNPLNLINRGLFLLFQFFIVFGIGTIIFKRRSIKLGNDYLALSLISFSVLVACVIVPYLSDYLDLERVYILTLPFLALFCIYGGEIFIELCRNLLNSAKSLIRRRNYMRTGNIRKTSSDLVMEKAYINFSPKYGGNKIAQTLVLIFILASFLLSSGFMIDLSGTKNWYPNLTFPGMTKDPTFSSSDTSAGEWLLNHMDHSDPAYADSTGRMLFFVYQGFGTVVQTFTLDENGVSLDKPLPENSYVYLRGFNLQQQTVRAEVTSQRSYKRAVKDFNLGKLLSMDSFNTVYTNGGGAEIFKGP